MFSAEKPLLCNMTMAPVECWQAKSEYSIERGWLLLVAVSFNIRFSTFKFFKNDAFSVENWHEWFDRFVCSFYVLQWEIHISVHVLCAVCLIRTILKFTLFKVRQECQVLSFSHILYICDKCEHDKWMEIFISSAEAWTLPLQIVTKKTKWIQMNAEEKSNGREDEYKLKWCLYFVPKKL